MANFVFGNNCLSLTPTDNILIATNTGLTCCCNVTCTLVSSDGSALTLTSIQDVGADISIVSIDGVAYAGATDPPLPLSISGSETITIVLEICKPNENLNSTWSNRIDLVYTEGAVSGIGQALEFDWLNTCLQPIPASSWGGLMVPYVNGAPSGAAPSAFNTLDFGQVNIGQTGIDGFTIFNPSVCDLVVDWGGSCVALSYLTFNQPIGQFIVPAGGQIDFEVTYTPTLSDPAIWSCNLDFSTCNPEFIFLDLNIYGEAISGNPCLICDDVSLYTENHYIPVINNLCNPNANIVQTQGAIGEQKYIDFEFTYINPLLTGFKIWFNPVLYDFLCDYMSYYPGGVINQPPGAAWYIEYVSGMAATQMQLVGAGAAAVTQRNMTAEFVPVSANEFKIRFTFYLIEDIEDWVSSLFLQNRSKLLKAHKDEPTDLTPTLQSVYNMNKEICALFYLIDPNHPVTDPNTGIQSDFECYYINGFRVSWRFYNYGLYLAPAEMTNPLFTFERSGQQVNNFSTLQDTEAKFTITLPAASTPDDLVFWLIEVTSNNNAVDFETNYNSSRTQIVTNPAVGVLDNLLKSPSIVFTPTGNPNEYESECLVDLGVSVGQAYCLIGVVYMTIFDGSKVVNSFISDKIFVTDVPDGVCCPVDTFPFFQDYNGLFLFANCIEPTLQERITPGLWIFGGDLGEDWKTDDPCLVQWGLSEATAASTWFEYLTDIKAIVYRKIDDYPTPGKTTYFVFEELVSTRNVIYPGNWQNQQPPLIVNEGTITAVPYYYIQVRLEEIRVRYEDQLTPSIVYVSDTDDECNRTDAGSLAQTYVAANNVSYDWADQDIYIEFQLNFDFSSLFGGSEYKITQLRRMLMTPYDYENPPSDFRNLDEIEFFEYSGNPVSPQGAAVSSVFCAGSLPFNEIVVRVHRTDAFNNYTFIAFADKYPYSINNLSEYESYLPGSGIFPIDQLQELPVIDADGGFNQVTGFAFFRVDLSVLAAGKYKLCGMAKRQRRFWSPLGG